MKTVKALRTFAAFVFLMAVFGFAITALVNFGIALFTQSGDALVSGFSWLIVTVVAMILTSMIMPKTKKDGDEAVNDNPSKKPVHTVRAVVIPADPAQPVRHATIPDDLDNLQRMVGGYIEAVGAGTDWVAYANEDGKSQRLPLNRRATHVMGFMGGHNMEDPIVGNVVFTGRAVTGESTDVPDTVSGRIDELAAEVGV